jgi:ketosteroid isomerase-like protein
MIGATPRSWAYSGFAAARSFTGYKIVFIPDVIEQLLELVSVNAAKQLASRARRRVQGSDPIPDADLSRQREVVDAFLAASRSGEFEALLAVLDPDIVLRADTAGVQMGASGEERGAAAVAGVFSGRALGAQPALVDGTVGVACAPGGQPKVVWDFTIANGKVVRIDMIAAADSLRELDLVLFDG